MSTDSLSSRTHQPWQIQARDHGQGISAVFRRCLYALGLCRQLGCATLPISLTPRFSEVHGRGYYDNRFSGLLVHGQETPKAVGLPQASLTPS